jgi:hypothetical protein
MTVLGWVIVIIIVAAVAAVVGALIVRMLRRRAPQVPDALEHLPSRKEQPVAYEDGRPVSEAEEPAEEPKDDVTFERVLHEELDEVRGDEPKA